MDQMNSDLLEGFCQDCLMRNIKSIETYRVYVHRSSFKDEKANYLDLFSALY
jgi:hypothetical protein